LVDATQKIPAKDEAPFYELRFVPQSIVPSRPQCQGSPMNAPQSGAPLTPLPARQGVVCPRKLLDNADDLIHGQALNRSLCSSPGHGATTKPALRASWSTPAPSQSGPRVSAARVGRGARNACEHRCRVGCSHNDDQENPPFPKSEYRTKWSICHEGVWGCQTALR